MEKLVESKSGKKRLLMITPHLSTGGLPQVFYKKVVNLYKYYEMKVIEYENITADVFVVQKNKLRNFLQTDDFITLGSDKSELINIIKNFQPHYIHFEEIPELFMNNDIIKNIYTSERNYYITETTHNVTFNTCNKKFIPDKFMHVSKYIATQFSSLNVPYEIIEYPIEKKKRSDRTEALKRLGLDPEYKHVLNVGLFTPGKNQKQIFDIAKLMKNEKIKFHMVGNQAENFSHYWKPLMLDKPDNCIIWGERSDVDSFYDCMDLFLFTSTHELNPIVIKEALSWDMKILMNNLEPYAGVYDNNKNIQFLDDNIFNNINMIKNTLYGTTTDTIEYKLPKTCYITYCTRNYIETTFGLIYSLIEFSKYPVVIYTINFNINDFKNPFVNNKNIHFIEYIEKSISDELQFMENDLYIDRNNENINNILFLRPKILLSSLENGVKNGIYLDSDFIARYNVDDLFMKMEFISDYPLFTRGVYDIVFSGHSPNNEQPLMDYLKVKQRSMHYVQTGIILFNHDCINFLIEWDSLCSDKIILDNRIEYAPYNEETIANVLLWKKSCTKHLPLSYFNIRNLQFVEEFYTFDDTDKSLYSHKMQGFPFFINGEQMEWCYIPYEKEQTKLFHGLKKLDEIIDVIEYQKAKINKNNIFLTN